MYVSCVTRTKKTGTIKLEILDYYDSFAISLKPAATTGDGTTLAVTDGSSWAEQAGAAVHAVLQAAANMNEQTQHEEHSPHLSWNVVFCHKVSVIYEKLRERGTHTYDVYDT